MKNGELIKKMRIYRNLNKSQLAVKVGMSRQQILALENAEDFKFTTFQKICEILEFKIIAIPFEKVTVTPVFDSN